MLLRPRPSTRSVAAVACGLLLSGTAAVAPASAGPRTAGGTDRPPSRPADVAFATPAAPCATGEDRPVLRSGTPTLSAVLRDRDGDLVAAAVTVTDLLPPAGGTVVFSSVGTPQASGTPQVVALEGLVDRGVYRVRVRGVDAAGRSGPAVTCEVEVDLVAPAPPTVVAVAVGDQPVYLPGVPAGGVGRPGSFVLGDGGSDDVVAYRWSLAGSPVTEVAGPSPTITVTPSSPGTNLLTVQSVDRAGQVSPVTLYDLVVPFAVPGALVWSLDEPSGTTAASRAADGTDPLPLTLDPALDTARVPGRLALVGSTTDLAVAFDGGGAVARSAAPAVTTSGSFAVTATVRSTDATGAATAVSQDGTGTAGFRLGQEPCATGAGSCWAFSVPTADDATAASTTVLSGVTVQPGAWVQVTGVHDAAAGTLGLWVCHPAIDDFGELAYVLTDAGTVPAGAPWGASGPLRVGGAAGPLPSPWSGAVGEVRTSPAVVTEASLQRLCTPAA